MEPMCIVLQWISATALLAAVALIINHKHRHSNPERPYIFIQDPVEQWFEAANVLQCNFRSHEMWSFISVVVSLSASVTHIVLISSNRC